ncbi:hypothetical protein KIN20_018553 [Parelaphostrongylus tenuis]|uniref:Uncharacterized protein n=1 Tax=Parelaphostrongylus tenuis TaxID=148309 RepID=A0AAD5QPP7_PARTN|nr:hypothetical protein KIN20_018553 [Parelaphostrongylus tenuis]
MVDALFHSLFSNLFNGDAESSHGFVGDQFTSTSFRERHLYYIAQSTTVSTRAPSEVISNNFHEPKTEFKTLTNLTERVVHDASDVVRKLVRVQFSPTDL